MANSMPARAGDSNGAPASLIALVAAGRRRWKIENENNNTLKTKGYQFEHNFGHGKQISNSKFACVGGCGAPRRRASSVARCSAPYPPYRIGVLL